MADGRKSVFKRPERPNVPALGPDAERFIHQDTPAEQPRQETPTEAAASGQVETGSKGEDTPKKAETLKRLTIDIPESLHKRVKSQCATKGTTIAEVVRKYLERAFPEQERRKDQ